MWASRFDRKSTGAEALRMRGGWSGGLRGDTSVVKDDNAGWVGDL